MLAAVFVKKPRRVLRPSQPASTYFTWSIGKLIDRDHFIGPDIRWSPARTQL
jgi:hypothetical protein